MTPDECDARALACGARSLEACEDVEAVAFLTLAAKWRVMGRRPIPLHAPPLHAADDLDVTRFGEESPRDIDQPMAGQI
jgi:hypothetical protein